MIKKRDKEFNTPEKSKNRRSLPIDLKNHPLTKTMGAVMKDHSYNTDHSPAIKEFLRRVRKD